MPKRSGTSARSEHALRRTEGNHVARSRSVTAKQAKKVTSLAKAPPSATKGPANAKRLVKSPVIVPARATSSRRNVGTVPHSERSALLPLRIPTPPPPPIPRSMELEWTNDPEGSPPHTEGAFDRWVRRGDALLRKLAEHGAANDEYRTNLREGRFFWVDPRGRVSAEARAKLICTFVPQTASLTMGWADPALRGEAVGRILGMPSEVDDIDEEGAWRIAMATAEHADAEYIYRVRSPTQCLFLALSALSFSAARAPFIPTTPVAMALVTLGEARVAANLGAEPVDTLRARLTAAGAVLLEQSEYAYRETEWVARLVWTGKQLGALAERLPQPASGEGAKGASSTRWLDRTVAQELVDALAILEEEWRQLGG
jgi:hypothetical protein